MTETEAIQRGICPSPFADAVANMYADAMRYAPNRMWLPSIADHFKLNIAEASLLIGWSLKSRVRK